MTKIVFFLFIVCGQIFSQGISNAFYSSEIGASARTIRLANIEGFGTSSYSVFENPASLYRIRRLSASGFTSELMDEVRYENLSLAFRLSAGVVGLGLMRVGVDDIYYTGMSDNEFYIVDTFSYRNYMAKIAYQYSFSRFFHVGASYTYYLTHFHLVKGNGYNLDIGFFLDSDRLDFSFVIKNALRTHGIHYTDDSTVPQGYSGNLSDISSDGMEEKLPFQTVFGLRYSLERLTFYGQFKTIGKDRQFVNSGGISYSPSLLPFLYFSGGYKQMMFVQSIEGQAFEGIHSALTLGIGLDLLGISVDYAVEDSEYYKTLANHFFSVGLSF